MYFNITFIHVFSGLCQHSYGHSYGNYKYWPGIQATSTNLGITLIIKGNSTTMLFTVCDVCINENFKCVKIVGKFQKLSENFKNVNL